MMSAMASQIISLAIVNSAVYSGADQRKHQRSASLAFCKGIPPVTAEFPAQRASDAENVSIRWRHHDIDHWDPGPLSQTMFPRYNNVIMGSMASQITSLAVVYPAVYSGADQRRHQSSASLAFVRSIHRWLMNSPHKWRVTRKMFPFDDVIMFCSHPCCRQVNYRYENVQMVRQMCYHDMCKILYVRLQLSYIKTHFHKIRIAMGKAFAKWAPAPNIYVNIEVPNAYLHPHHDAVIKWKHFPCYCRFVRGIHRSPDSWTNGWANNRDAGDLRRRRAHYDVTVMTPPHP